MSMKNPLTPAGIEPATFRFVAQHLTHCATAVPYKNTTCQLITQHFILYTIKIVYCQGDMFRHLLSHPILQRST